MSARAYRQVYTGGEKFRLDFIAAGSVPPGRDEGVAQQAPVRVGK